MSDLVRRTSGLSPREARQVGRDLSRVDANGRIELSRIHTEADLQAERVSAIAYVTKRGLHEVALVSEIELQLTELAPSAAPRLQAIADLGALQLAETVGDTLRRLR